MNLKRFIKKNIIFIVLFLVLLFGVAYLKTTEGFQTDISNCDMDYCIGDFEVVKDNSGQILGCFKKCSSIKENSTPAISNPLTCRDMSGTRVVRTFSRNYKSYKLLNFQGNNQCQIIPNGYKYDASNNSILATPNSIPHNSVTCKDRNGKRVGNKCLICPIVNSKRDRNGNLIVSRPTPDINNMCDARKAKVSYK